MSTISAYTMEDWVRAMRDERYSVDKYTFDTLISNGSDDIVRFMNDTVLSKYHAELEQYKMTLTWTPAEQEFLQYNPRMVAYNVYGKPELWYLVLYANSLHSALQFVGPRIHLYSADVLLLLDAIRELETNESDYQEQQLTNIILSGKPINNEGKIQITV